MILGISKEEKELIEQIKQMGYENEDTDKILAFCQMVYKGYREKKISAAVYENIYALAKCYMKTKNS